MEPLRRLCESVDLTQVASPYLPKTFTKWRRETGLPPSLDFVREVDEELLPRFLSSVTAAYFHSICTSPDYSHMATCPEFQHMASILAHWNTELELAMDLLDRAQLYGLMQASISFPELQKEWDAGTEPAFQQMYRFLLQSVGFLADRTAGLIRTYVIGQVAGNMERSRNVIIAGTVYAYLCGSVPWAVLAILGTQTVWVVSGWLLMKAGKGIGAGFDQKQMSIHLKELSEQFASLTSQLRDLNDRTRTGIRACLAATSPQERMAPMQDLNRALENFMQKRVGGERDQRSFSAETAALEYIRVQEAEDWLVIEAEEPEVVQLSKSLFTID